MKHATFVIGSWVLTFAAVTAYAAFVIRRGRELAKHVNKEDLPWT